MTTETYNSEALFIMSRVQQTLQLTTFLSPTAWPWNQHTALKNNKEAGSKFDHSGYEISVNYKNTNLILTLCSWLFKKPDWNLIQFCYLDSLDFSFS